MKADIVIIGAGVIGSSVAYHLTERGINDVLLLERAPEQGTARPEKPPAACEAGSKQRSIFGCLL